MPLKITLVLEDADLRHFRRAMREAKSALETIGEEAILEGADKLMERSSQRELPKFVTDRLADLQLFVEMIRDQRWSMPKRVRDRCLTALAYFTEPNDIIPDEIPGIGLLDDAIMVELVLREMKHEIEAYRDFRAFGYDKEGPAEEGVIEERKFRERRESLRKRIRRRSQRDSDRASGWKSSLW